ncbi:hypothetical protein OHA21_17745 [Actinoplanes sp. NBC_00393]|uniref:hypothetical protein n=1 Tax=Actinoplanes sp. NBC_00393 TaxID=2975953 RepID=UPI002E23025B
MVSLQVERSVDGTAQRVGDTEGGVSALSLATATIEVAGDVVISRRGDGAVLLTLGTERRWVLRQLGTGPGTALELASIGGAAEGQPIANKNLIINTSGKVGIGTTTPQATLDVNGSIRVADDVVLAGADCAEEFDLAPETCAEPGTVLVIGAQRRLHACTEPYDRRVAGIVSGAHDRPGIVLGRRPAPTGIRRVPIALNGTVWCWADAADDPIRVGDLLTTGTRPGHAMRAADSTRAFGAIVGKALADLSTGTGRIPVLATLQ